MINQQLYITLLEAAHNILSRNVRELGDEFCNGFMIDHDPNKARDHTWVERFFGYAERAVLHQNNGNPAIRNTEQLFYIVGEYIKEIHRLYQETRRGGFGGQPQPMSFSGGGNGFNFSGGAMSLNTSSHMKNDNPLPPANYTQPTFAAVAPVTVPSVPVKDAITMAKFNINPFDDFPKDDSGFHPVSAKDCWGGELPRDHTFVVSDSTDLKNENPKYTIRKLSAKSRTVFGDSFDVTKRFFKVVPESLLSKVFIAEIQYDHLEIIDVPTADLVAIRSALKELSNTNRFINPFYRSAIEFAMTLKHGSFKALNRYLVKHINRALFLNCRIKDNPEVVIKITSIEDLNDLLSSNFTSSLTQIPDGRNKIKQIVEYSIMNALCINSSIMFESKTDFAWGVDIMKTSAVFPDSIPEVYPTKIAIPSAGDENFDMFTEAMIGQELSTSSYILSRRSVIITNLLGRNVLPNINLRANRFEGILPSMFNPYGIDFLQGSSVLGNIRDPGTVYNTQETDLRSYYEKVEKDDRDVIIKDHHGYTGNGFVDQMVFAIEFNGNPMDYLTAFDVITPMDSSIQHNGSAIFIKHPIKSIQVV